MGNDSISTVTLEDLRDDNGAYPPLKRTFTSVQTGLMILGIPTLTLYGIGVVLILVGLVLHWLSPKFRVRDLDNQRVYFLSREDYRKYKQISEKSMQIHTRH